MQTISQVCTQLKELSIYNAIGFKITNKEINYIKQLSNFKKFEFVNCEYIINHKIINNLLLAIPKLEWLNLSNNWSFGYSCSHPLIIPIFDISFPSLHTLILNNIKIFLKPCYIKQKKEKIM